MARSGLGLVAVLLLGVGAGCGRESSGSGDTGTAQGAAAGSGSTPPPPETTTRPPLSSIPPPTMRQPIRPPTNPSDQIKPVTVTGRVSLSDGCIDLVTSTVRWTLLGSAAADLQDGAEVEIYGMPSPQLQSRCGDAPLRVTEVRPR